MIREFLEEIPNAEVRKKAISASRWAKTGLVSLIAGIGLLGSFYTVPANSVAIVKRFGAYTRQEDSGLKMKIPLIESVEKVPVTLPQTEEFGFIGTRKDLKGKKNQEAILQSEYLMLTGDLNMADVEWIIQYNIKDPKAYLFNVRDPQNLLRDCSLHVVKQLTGNRSVDEVITIGREEYENASKVELQKLLDECGSGIHVIVSKIQSTHAPQRVRPSFNAVSEAMQKKEEKISNAMEGYNQVVPKAEGEAKKLVEDARGYYAERVNHARGDVMKFSETYRQYAKSPEITRDRMWFEARSELLGKLNNLSIVEQKGIESGLWMRYDLKTGDKK